MSTAVTRWIKDVKGAYIWSELWGRERIRCGRCRRWTKLDDWLPLTRDHHRTRPRPPGPQSPSCTENLYQEQQHSVCSGMMSAGSTISIVYGEPIPGTTTLCLQWYNVSRVHDLHRVWRTYTRNNNTLSAVVRYSVSRVHYLHRVWRTYTRNNNTLSAVV